MSDYVGKSPISYELGKITLKECIRLRKEFKDKKYRDYREEFVKMHKAFEVDAYKAAGKGYNGKAGFDPDDAMISTFNQAFTYEATNSGYQPVPDVTIPMFVADFKDFLIGSGFKVYELSFGFSNSPGGEVYEINGELPANAHGSRINVTWEDI